MATSGEGTATVTRDGAAVAGVSAEVVQTYAWNPTGTMCAMSDPYAGTATPAWWAYEYTPANEPYVETSPVDKMITRIYDAHGNVIYDFDEEGHRTAYRYDAFDQVISQTDPRGCTTFTSYDVAGNRIVEERVLDGVGSRSRVEYSYNASGTVTQERRRLDATTWAVTRYSDFGPSGEAGTTYQDGVKLSSTAAPITIETSRAFDAWGNTVSETDALGTTTYQRFDGLGMREIESEDASGVVSVSVHDALGNTVESYRTLASDRDEVIDLKRSVIDAFGRTRLETTYRIDGGVEVVESTITHTFDALGRETASDHSLTAGLAAHTHFDARGNATSSWAEGLTSQTSSSATRNEYDEYGQLLRSWASGENTPTAYTYAPDGLVTEQINPDGTWTRFTYDDAGNKTSEIKPKEGGGTLTTAYRYDLGGRLVSTTDAAGITTTSGYDLADRVVSTQGGAGQPASTTVYNALGWTLTATDTDGAVTASVYDAAGRVLSSTVAGKTTTTVYDTCGRTVCTTDPDGKDLAYEYDAFGRTWRETHTTEAGVIKDTTMTYDSLSRVASADDELSDVTRTFLYPTAPGQGTTVAMRYASLTTTITADATGEETARISALPGAGALARTVTARDDARRETGWSVGDLAFSRTLDAANGRLTDLAAPGLSIGFDYGATGRKTADTGTGALLGGSTPPTPTPTPADSPPTRRTGSRPRTPSTRRVTSQERAGLPRRPRPSPTTHRAA